MSETWEPDEDDVPFNFFESATLRSQVELQARKKNTRRKWSISMQRRREVTSAGDAEGKSSGLSFLELFGWQKSARKRKR